MATSPLRWLRRLYRWAHRLALRALNGLGINVSLVRDYYSPLPVRRELERHPDRWRHPSDLVGLQIDLPAMKGRLVELVERHAAEASNLPSTDEVKRLGYGPGFTAVDAQILHWMVRDLRPRRYLEVGSGVSTYYALLAARRNAGEGRPCRLTCIDPFPRPALIELGEVEVQRAAAQDLEPGLFTALVAGDVLFIDSTHVVKVGGEVAFLILEVLPRLAPGVVVHLHDVHFPYNLPYPPERYLFGGKWPSYWTEAMLLQAFLAFNEAFGIELSVPLLRFHDEPFLATALPGYRPVDPDDFDTHCSSIWLRRKAAPDAGC